MKKLNLYHNILVILCLTFIFWDDPVKISHGNVILTGNNTITWICEDNICQQLANHQTITTISTIYGPFYMILASIIVWEILFYNYNRTTPVTPEPTEVRDPVELQEIGTVKTLEEDLDLHCSICIEFMVTGEIVKELTCEHKFHQTCVDEWLESNQNCPNCRADEAV